VTVIDSPSSTIVNSAEAKEYRRHASNADIPNFDLKIGVIDVSHRRNFTIVGYSSDPSRWEFKIGWSPAS
tara:strand:- start:811 stop:1020 length:210 start_codon:yes stop_codon:yes gene_type:complete